MKTKDEFYKLEILKSKRKYYRIEQIISGLKRIDYCILEMAFYWTPFTEIVVKLNDKIGEEWPDLLSDYHWENYLILSKRTFGIFEENGISNLMGYKVKLDNANPEELILKEPPNYYLVNGQGLVRAEVDFVKSGNPNYYFCKECGKVRLSVDDIWKRIQSNEKVPSVVFKDGPWRDELVFTVNNGLDDKYGYAYYCNGKFLEIVKKNRLTNFRFSTLDGNKSFSFL